ncbi:amidohydrolase family protein [Salinibacterium sp. ZJ450]|uniref:amidohydrolase family protein n=1 Tax=Salinibacterium sp. ZJ450 TaxID=2708338 RepID=UPI00141DE9F4|nr:amidohydrolase family protein [Salinibacterium sp. ZJ450]
MIIDTHTHLLDIGHWPEEWWDWVAQDWAGRAPGRRPEQIRDRIESGLIDPDAHRMITRMNRAGVDASVLLPIDWGPGFTTGRPISHAVDQTLRLARQFPGRLIPFGGIDPRRQDATGTVRDWFERGIRGLKLYPGCGWHPSSDEAMEIYALAVEYDAPVLFHTGDPLPLMNTALSDPILLLDVVRAFPALRVWLGHAGAPTSWAEALEVAGAGPRVRLEMSVWLWDDSDPAAELDFARKILEAADAVGWSRLMFGTDHVSGSKVRGESFLDTVVGKYQRLPDHARTLGGSISAEQLSSLLGGVAAEDLGLQ